jgi:hypothetical protein
MRAPSIRVKRRPKRERPSHMHSDCRVTLQDVTLSTKLLKSLGRMYAGRGPTNSKAAAHRSDGFAFLHTRLFGCRSEGHRWMFEPAASSHPGRPKKVYNFASSLSMADGRWPRLGRMYAGRGFQIRQGTKTNRAILLVEGLTVACEVSTDGLAPSA